MFKALKRLQLGWFQNLCTAIKLCVCVLDKFCMIVVLLIAFLGNNFVKWRFNRGQRKHLWKSIFLVFKGLGSFEPKVVLTELAGVDGPIAPMLTPLDIIRVRAAMILRLHFAGVRTDALGYCWAWIAMGVAHGTRPPQWWTTQWAPWLRPSFNYELKSAQWQL